MVVERKDGSVVRYGIEDVARVYYDESNGQEVDVIDATSSNFKFFILDDKECEVVGLINGSANIVIPEKVRINGVVYTITGVGDYLLGESEFDDKIKSVTVPKTIKNIGEAAFAWCENLTDINVAADNPNYTSLNGVLYDKKMTELICCPGGLKENLEIPSGVTKIADRAFSRNQNIKSVVIPSTVISIGLEAFEECSNLKKVNIPSSVTSIGGYAFHFCSSLTELTIQSSVTSIGYSAFGDCTSATIVVDNTEDNIKFYYYDGEEVDICSSSAFSGCKSVTIKASSAGYEESIFVDGGYYDALNDSLGLTFSFFASVRDDEVFINFDYEGKNYQFSLSRGGYIFWDGHRFELGYSLGYQMGAFTQDDIVLRFTEDSTFDSYENSTPTKFRKGHYKCF